MKRKVFLVLIALVATIGVSAQDSKTTTKTETPRKACFVDNNANGICDNHESGTCKVGNGKGLQDGSGQGYCRGKGQGKGNAYRCGRGCQNSKGMNAGKGLRNGRGCNNGGKGARFVDANNNGVCDYRENADESNASSSETKEVKK